MVAGEALKRAGRRDNQVSAGPVCPAALCRGAAQKAAKVAPMLAPARARHLFASALGRLMRLGFARWNALIDMDKNPRAATTG
jgi:hypothetical protein